MANEKQVKTILHVYIYADGTHDIKVVNTDGEVNPANATTVEDGGDTPGQRPGNP